MSLGPHLPLWQSVLWIVSSVLVCSSVSYHLLQNHVVKKQKKAPDLPQALTYVVQTGLQKEALHSDYLAELLDLAADRPILFDDFEEEPAAAKLLQSPLFEEAQVRKIPPNMVYIDYTVRKPLAWVSDFVNTVVDKEGHLFPMAPFFSPKKLPELYLGAQGVQGASFSSVLQGKCIDLSFKILDLFKGREKESLFLKRVDVADAFYPTLGRRGITLIIENDLQEGKSFSTHFLRLSTAHFTQEITNYFHLRPHLLETEKEKILAGEKLKERVIDLRISQLAFVD